MPKFIPFNVTIPYRHHEKLVENLCKTDGKYAEIETVCTLILFAIKMNVCYQLFEHLAWAYFPSFSSSYAAIVEEKASKTLSLSDERKCLKLNFFMLFTRYAWTKTAYCEQFILSRKKKSIFNALLYLDWKMKKLGKNLKRFLGGAKMFFIDIRNNHDNCMIYWQIYEAVIPLNHNSDNETINSMIYAIYSSSALTYDKKKIVRDLWCQMMVQ